MTMTPLITKQYYVIHIRSTTDSYAKIINAVTGDEWCVWMPDNREKRFAYSSDAHDEADRLKSEVPFVADARVVQVTQAHVIIERT